MASSRARAVATNSSLALAWRFRRRTARIFHTLFAATLLPGFAALRIAAPSRVIQNVISRLARKEDENAPGRGGDSAVSRDARRSSVARRAPKNRARRTQALTSSCSDDLRSSDHVGTGWSFSATPTGGALGASPSASAGAGAVSTLDKSRRSPPPENSAILWVFALTRGHPPSGDPVGRLYSCRVLPR